MLQFKLPQMSLTMQEGTVIRWVAEEGAKIKRGETLLEIETDKTSAELSAPCDGTLVKRMFSARDVVGVGEVICIIDDGAGDGPAYEKESAAPGETAGSTHPAAAASAGRRGKLTSPLAARIAADKGVNLDGVTGTGPRGIIVKKDVETAAAAPKCARQTDDSAQCGEGSSEVYGPYRDIAFTGVRKRTADNMMCSRQNTATVTTFVDADMSGIKRMREFVKATYTAYVVKAAANALREIPELNASLIGESIRMYGDANINVAVASGDKLVTPVVRRCDKRSLFEINDEIAAYADQGRNGRIALRDFEGGTFTVTNSGVFGSMFFTPIINYPQCAILGMGKTTDTPVVRDGQIVIAPVMKLCLSYDHRLVDGATAVKFLVQVKDRIENPGDLLR